MTELMKRYEAETGKVMSRLMEIFADADKHSKEELINVMTELYMYGLHLENQVLDGKTIEKFQEIIRNQCDEISALKAQLTWRPVSKGLPEEAGLYFVEAKPYTGCESKIITTAYFNGERFLWHTVVSYFPIPTSPEGEVK